MKNIIKKSFCLVLVMLTIFSLCACGQKNTNNSSNKLVVAFNAEFPPYEYKENNEFLGIDPDMLREIGSRLGKEVEFMDIEFSSVIPSVQSGKADIGASGITVTEERKAFINFTDMYQDAVQKVIVMKGSSIKSIEDLKGKIIALQIGTTSDLYASKDFEDKNIQRYPKVTGAVQALLSGKADCVITDDQVAVACVAENKAKGNDVMEILDAPYVEEHYAMAISKENTELLNAVNKALSDMKQDGTLDKIKAKYIKE